MRTSTKPEITPEPTSVTVTEDTLSVDLADGRTIAVPLGWYPRLANGSPEEWSKYELSPAGIHWPELDEDISVEGLLKGNKSGESPKSFQRWLEHRAKGEKPWLKPGYQMGD
ncbi:MAG: DUF2442 domain-containing protein [Phycisphaeraceae bacterium]